MGLTCSKQAEEVTRKGGWLKLAEFAYADYEDPETGTKLFATIPPHNPSCALVYKKIS